MEPFRPARMKFGIFMAPFHRPGEHPTRALERDLELVDELDRMGYDEVWFGEHHSAGWETIASPELMIAAAAQRTRTIKLGTGVVSLPYHHPFIVADRMVQLDHMTRGRALFGVGPGALLSDAYMLGIDPMTQRARMDEALDVIMRLLRGEVVTHRSDWFTLQEARLQTPSYTHPHVPVSVAHAFSPAGPVSAGKAGAGMLSMSAFTAGGGTGGIADAWRIAEETAAEHGKTVDRGEWRLVIPIHVAPDRQQAIDEIGEGCETFWNDYFGETLGRPVGTAYNIGSLIANGAVMVGTPADVTGMVEQLVQNSGGFGALLNRAQEWTSHENVLRSYDLFMRYVAPVFQGQVQQLHENQQWVAANRHTIFGANVEVMRKAFADAGVAVTEERLQVAKLGVGTLPKG